MVDLEMFACAKRRLSLTRRGCAALWTSAKQKPPAPWDSRAACVGCNVGARHAGQPEAPELSAAVEAWRRVCPRCRRVAFRMIAGRLCVSCYNRDREVAIGCDRKGSRPGLTDRLHAVSLCVTDGSKVRTICYASVLDLPEAMIAATRTATRPLIFSLPVPRWPAIAQDEEKVELEAA